MKRSCKTETLYDNVNRYRCNRWKFCFTFLGHFVINNINRKSHKQTLPNVRMKYICIINGFKRLLPLNLNNVYAIRCFCHFSAMTFYRRAKTVTKLQNYKIKLCECKLKYNANSTTVYKLQNVKLRTRTRNSRIGITSHLYFNDIDDHLSLQVTITV